MTATTLADRPRRTAVRPRPRLDESVLARRSPSWLEASLSGDSRQPSLSIVVVTHESADCISRCLESLRRHAPACRSEIIVVDNASQDGTADLVRSRFPEVQVVVADRRRGFAANCNHGARLARGEHLFFLNPDARVAEGTIDRLVDVLRSDPTVGVVGPRLRYPDGRPQASARRFPTIGATLVRRTPLRLIARDSTPERHHLMLDLRDGRLGGSPPALLQSVDWILGAAVAISADLYRALGGMDASYRLYCEDIDLCWRVWSSGRKVVQLQTAVAEHDLGELTRKRFLTRATWWHYTSMFRFVMKNGLRPPSTAVPAQSGRVPAWESTGPRAGASSAPRPVVLKGVT